MKYLLLSKLVVVTLTLFASYLFYICSSVIFNQVILLVKDLWTHVLGKLLMILSWMFEVINKEIFVIFDGDLLYSSFTILNRVFQLWSESLLLPFLIAIGASYSSSACNSLATLLGPHSILICIKISQSNTNLVLLSKSLK